MHFPFCFLSPVLCLNSILNNPKESEIKGLYPLIIFSASQQGGKDQSCESKRITTPLVPKVRYPHYGGQNNLESQAVEVVASVEHGVREADNFGKGN